MEHEFSPSFIPFADRLVTGLFDCVLHPLLMFTLAAGEWLISGLFKELMPGFLRHMLLYYPCPSLMQVLWAQKL